MPWPRKPKLEELMEEPFVKVYKSVFGDVRIISHPFLEPTERQMTLSRLTGRPPEDFIR